MKNFWKDNRIQFSRLLAEIGMLGLTRPQLKELKVSTDLSEDQINELFVRAVRDFEAVKNGFYAAR
jgi:hypothetical protein